MEVEKDKFRRELLNWYQENGRSFFWREETLNPFQIIVLEVLLRRTRAETVDKYGKQVIENLDSPTNTRNTSQQAIENMIEKLGYHSRAEIIKKIAEQLDDGVPEKRDELMRIDQIGQYIADSVICYAYGKPVVPLDSNVAIVGEAYFSTTTPSDLRYASDLKNLMNDLVSDSSPRDFNWALQDLGSALRTEENPLGL